MDPQMPEPGQTWRHTNGNKYEIIALANDPPTLAHPLSVIYRGENGKYWCRPLSDWHRSFSFEAAKEITFEEYKALGAERNIIPAFELRILEERVVWRKN